MTLEKLKSLCKYYKGENVVIYWDDPDWDWLTYKLLDCDFERDAVMVQGIPTPDGHKHDGSIFTAPIAEIHSIKPISEYRP